MIAILFQYHSHTLLATARRKRLSGVHLAISTGNVRKYIRGQLAFSAGNLSIHWQINSEQK